MYFYSLSLNYMFNYFSDIAESLAADQSVPVHNDYERITSDDAHSSEEESFYSAPELPPFLCPYCGKCSLEQFISDNGCPKKKSSSDSTVRFPYLNLSDLDEDNRIDLEDRLVDDTREMILQFATFTAMIRSSLNDLQVPLEDIKCSILSLEAFSEKIGAKVLDEKDREEIKSAKSVAGVFITLCNYVSFFNYDIIEHIIKLYGSADDHERLKEYVCAFNTFSERNVFEVPASVFSVSKSRTTAKVFALKCTQRVYSLEGVQSMKRKIAKVLGLKPLSLQLCSIKKGCVELHFLISSDVANRIFPVSPAHESALSDIGVRFLFCEEVEQEESRYIVVYILLHSYVCISQHILHVYIIFCTCIHRLVRKDIVQPPVDMKKCSNQAPVTLSPSTQTKTQTEKIISLESKNVSECDF